jgi:hypothetical protein
MDVKSVGGLRVWFVVCLLRFSEIADKFKRLLQSQKGASLMFISHGQTKIWKVEWVVKLSLSAQAPARRDIFSFVAQQVRAQEKQTHDRVYCDSRSTGND